MTRTTERKILYESARQYFKLMHDEMLWVWGLEVDLISSSSES